MTRVASGFRPSRNGFRFVNRFTLGGRGNYGLCGGMVRLAWLRFLQGRAIEPATRTPRLASRLYWRLQFEQWRSLRLPPLGLGSEAWRYAKWMRLSDEELERRTGRELERLRELLAPGRPVPLGLLRARKGHGRLWHNHQVLAFALDELEDGAARVLVYDPNHPLQDARGLHVRPSPDGVRTREVGPGGGSELPAWFVSGFAADR